MRLCKTLRLRPTRILRPTPHPPAAGGRAAPRPTPTEHGAHGRASRGAGATPQWGGGNWWEAPLEEIVVVRKEARRLPPDERARIGAAIKKMMTNDGGKGSSQF